jgi:hypothetical protein
MSLRRRAFLANLMTSSTLDKFVEENGTDALKKLANQVHEPYTSTPTSYFFTLI